MLLRKHTYLTAVAQFKRGTNNGHFLTTRSVSVTRFFTEIE